MAKIDDGHVSHDLVQVVFSKKAIADSKAHRLIYQPRDVQAGNLGRLEKALPLNLSIVVRDRKHGFVVH